MKSLRKMIPGRIRSDERGMTILEVLISVLIGTLVVYAAMQAYVTMHLESIWQDQINEMQQSGRAAMELISQRLRMAGFGLPPTLDALAGADGNPDTITVVHQSEDACQVSTSSAMAQPSDPLECDGSDVTCFSPGMTAYIYDPNGNTGEYFDITSVIETPASLIPSSSLSQTYPTGASVYHIEQLTFFLDRSDTLHPMLMRQRAGGAPEPYAENIEDLQFAYIMQSGDTVLTLTNPELVQSVLVDLVARTDMVDKDVEQDYRRRRYNFRVSIRNHETL